jgi:two-component system LytT family response regulator
MPAAEFGVLIADDEPAARRGGRRLLAGFPAFGVVGECRNGAEVLAALDVLKPDVVFLDVQMPGVDGFEVIRRRTPERMPAVVFLTAYDQFAIRAFDAQALDYLVKPVAEARFAATIRRLTKQLRGAAPAPGAGLVVTTSRGATLLAFAEIDWIEAADNYARLWLGGKSYLLREPLRALERRVRSHGFARAHRRALVRLDGVRALERGDDGDMVAALSSGTRVPVSRRCRAAFSAAFRSR